MCDDIGYLEVEKKGWTCVACMDRKVRDWKNILRHEKSEKHARAVGTWLSHRQLNVLLWLLKVNNIDFDVPSLKSMKTLEAKVHSLHGIRTLQYNSAFGNKYYVNSIADIISQVGFTGQ